MPSSLVAAGATPEPSQYAPLTMDRYITGLWTQRSPLRDADVPYLYAKFYSASRFDSIIDGLNRELTSKLTLKRRVGLSVYNSQNFAAITRYYSFKTVEGGVPTSHVMVDTATAVYDGTGPNRKTLIWTKSAGAGKTSFQSVGNTLYMANGKDNVKWVRSAIVWDAQTEFAQGEFIVDSNNNLQLAIGGQTANIANVQIQGNVLTLFFSPTTPLDDLPVNAQLALSGLTTAAFLNGQTVTITAVPNSLQVQANFVHADYAFAADTGAATTGTGESGAVAPGWSAVQGAVTLDGGLQWVCRGSSVQTWGITTPGSAPSATQVPAPSIYPAWQANTWYAPTAFAIVDSNGNIQQLTTAGTTGGAAPAWNAATGGTTNDNTCVWTNLGPAARAASTNVTLGTIISVTWTYYITITQYYWNGHESVPETEQVPVTQTAMFRCVTAGETSAVATSAIAWTNGLNTTVQDGSAVWQNIGAQQTWASFGAAAALSLDTKVLDSNFNIQAVQTRGKSGAAAPVWASSQGSITSDNSTTWSNTGPFGAANTGAWMWGYSYGNSIAGHSGTMSPQSAPLIVAAGQQPVIQGVGSADAQDDTIYIWRTAQGQSVFLLLDQVPNPGGGKPFIYTDTTADTGLGLNIAPTASQNNPPPAGLTGLCYHLGHVWGVAGNVLYRSMGPDVNFGNGNEAWAPVSNYQLPELAVGTISATIQNGALLVCGNANMYIVMGTSSSTFTAPRTFMAGVGFASWDAITVVGSTIYGFTSNSKFVSLDPSGGYIECGFPIGDQFTNTTTGNNFGGVPVGALYNPSSTYVAWNERNSGDSGIYVADGVVGWFRYSPVAAPESGYLWSPRAAIVGGTSAVQSIETEIGVQTLLVGPQADGPILMRDETVFTDNEEDYTACYVTIGSVVLCEPGEIAEVAFVTLDSLRIGSQPQVGMLYGEISSTATIPFDMMDPTDVDPPDLPPSETLFNDRYMTMHDGICPKCRHCQVMISWPAQQVGDELLAHAIYGAKYAERKEEQR